MVDRIRKVARPSARKLLKEFRLYCSYSGLSEREIAADIGVPRSTAVRWIRPTEQGGVGNVGFETEDLLRVWLATRTAERPAEQQLELPLTAPAPITDPMAEIARLRGVITAMSAMLIGGPNA